MKRRTLGRGGEPSIEFGEELSGFRAMEVALGFGVFRDVFGLRRGAVEPEREDAVPVAWALVQRGDIAVESEVLRAQGERLSCSSGGGGSVFGRGAVPRGGTGFEQDGDEAGEAGLGGGFAVGESALRRSEGEVVPGGFRIGVRGGGKGRERVEVERRPDGAARFAGDAERVQGALGRFETAGLLVVVEDAGERVEGFGSVGVSGKLGACLGDEGALAMSLLEQRKVSVDELRRPERLEGSVVNGQGGLRLPRRLSIRASGAYGEGRFLRKLMLEAEDDGLGGSIVALVELEIEECGVECGLVGVAGEECGEDRGCLRCGQALIAQEQEEAVVGAPGALLGGVEEGFRGKRRRSRHLIEDGNLLRDEQAALVEIG